MFNAREFCTRFRRKLLQLIDDPDSVYMLGIATLLDGMRRSVKLWKKRGVWSCGTSGNGQRRSGQDSRILLMHWSLQ